MIPIEPKNRLNAFKAVPIPSARKLFERYGYSLQRDGHPDNTDPYHFNEPSNVVGSTDMEMMSRAGAAATRAALAKKSVDDLPADDLPATDEKPIDSPSEEKGA